MYGMRFGLVSDCVVFLVGRIGEERFKGMGLLVGMGCGYEFGVVEIGGGGGGGVKGICGV